MPILRENDGQLDSFEGGATYRTLVGDDKGSTPLRVGVQTSPPGFNTGSHYHPYLEVVTVLSGDGEAWIEGEGDPQPIATGDTMVFPPNARHWFRTVGDGNLVTCGIHASPDRIVLRED